MTVPGALTGGGPGHCHRYGTVIGARHAGQAGELSPGKRADIVAVAGDPLDLANLKENIRAVYKDGRQVRGTLLPPS